MKVKNIFLKLTAIAFLAAFSLKAEIPVTQIRGLASVLTQDKQYLSPVWGATLWNSPYVENLYRFGLPTSNTVKLARSIFFVHHDDVTFDTTYLATRIATYFTPYLIGQLVGLIDNYQINMQKLAEYKTQVAEKRKSLIEKNADLSGKEIARLLTQQEPKLLENIKDVSRVKSKTPQEIKDVINAFEKENKDKIQEKINTYFEKRYIPKLEADLKKDPENKKLLQQLQKAKDNKDSGIKNSTYKQYKDEFLNFLVKSLGETNLFIPNNTIFLLLGSLWKKTNDKNEFLSYFAGLKDKHNNKEELFNNPEFPTNGFPEDAFEYTEADYNTFKEANKEKVKTKYINNIEALAFLHLGYSLFDNPLPPEVGMLDSVKYGEFLFPDCGGTSLLNFFNVILYDKDKQEFNLEYLNDFNVNPKLTTFYTKYKKPTKMKTRQAHDDWAVVTSDLEDVSYINGGICEINIGLKNMLKVVENLVGTKTFEEFTAKLTANGFEVEIEYKNENIDIFDQNNTVFFYLKKPNTNFFNIEWKFDTNHFQLIFPSSDKLFSQNYINALKIFNDLNMYNTEKNIIFFNLYVDNKPYTNDFYNNINTIKTNINSNLLTQYLYFTILIQNTFAPEKKGELLENIIKHEALDHNEKLLITFAKSLYLAIPEDQYPQETYFRVIFKNMPNIFDTTKKPFNDMSDIKMAYAINIIFNTKDISENLIDWAKNSLEKINNEKAIAILIGGILTPEQQQNFNNNYLREYVKNNINKLQSEEEKTILYCYILRALNKISSENKPFSEFLIKWVKDNLNTIKKNEFKYDIIDYILDCNIQDQELITWATENFSKMEFSVGNEQGGGIICAIFKNHSTNQTLMREAKKNLPLVSEDGSKYGIIRSILENITDPELIQWVKETLPFIQNDSSKIEIINIILKKQLTSSDLIKWIKDTLPTIQEEYRKIEIINEILDLENPNPILLQAIKDSLYTIQENSNKGNIIQKILDENIRDLFPIVNEVLPTMQQDESSFVAYDHTHHILKTIVEKNIQDLFPVFTRIFPTYNLYQAYQKAETIQKILDKNIQDLFPAVSETLPKIRMDKLKIALIKRIIDENIESLFPAIVKTLPTIQKDYAKHDIIQKILDGNIEPLFSVIKDVIATTTDDFTQQSILSSIILSKNIKNPTLIQCVKESIPTIKNDFNKKNIIQQILYNNIQTLFPIISETLPTFQEDYEKYDIIQEILDKNIEPLFPTIKDAISKAKDEQWKVNTLSMIFSTNFQNPILIQYVKDTIPTILKNSSKEYIIREILEKYNQDKDLMQWAKDTLPTLPVSDFGKPDLVNIIINKDLQTILNIKLLLDIATTMQKKFSEYLKQNKKIKKGLKKKIRKIKAEIKRRKSDEEAVVSLGFLSKVKQFWKKLTFKKQSKTIIKAA